MITLGDRVRAHYFKQRFNRRSGSYERDLICTKRGTVVLLSRDQAMVKFDGEHKPERIPVSSLEKIQVPERETQP